MKTKKINQKPTKIDLHLKYKCPNKECSYEHWLSLKETQTKNFKVVCDCGIVFKPKRIDKINIVYNKPKARQENKNNSESVVSNKNDQEDTIKIPVDILEKASTILTQYGFTLPESKKLIKESYQKEQCSDIVLLVKNSLKTFGG